MKRSDKAWTAARYRHKSGSYYARLRIAGKQTWWTLGTEILSVAQHELTAILQAEPQIENDASTKSSTKKYWQEIHLALRRSWPELESLVA
ncbi:MAG: hypothetical protein R3F19_22805 [Verrucomicrobiales bacterium]